MHDAYRLDHLALTARAAAGQLHHLAGYVRHGDITQPAALAADIDDAADTLDHALEDCGLSS